MKISVIIPTYNRKKYIKRAIDSVIRQSYKPFEIIVIDDGSTDGTYELIKKSYSSSQISLEKQINNGVSSARNKGVKLANGDWIAFLDSDDEWFKDKLELVFREVINMSSDYNCIIHNEIYVNKKLLQIEQRSLWNDRRDIITKTRLYNIIEISKNLRDIIKSIHKVLVIFYRYKLVQFF